MYGSNSYADALAGTSANSSFKLSNSGGTLSILLDTLDMDAVDFTTSFPYSTGISAELSVSTLDSVSNDTDTNWCAAVNLFSTTDGDSYGTPGSVNDCP